jgi:DNA-binding CsgD family transcriptional regulator
MDDRTTTADDAAAQSVYRHMRLEGTTLEQAVERAGRPLAETPRIRARLAGLGLLDPAAEVATDAAAALSRMLDDGRDRLAEALRAIAEHQNDALTLATGYLGTALQATGAAVEIMPKDDRFRLRMETLLEHAAATTRAELVAMHPNAVWDERYFGVALERTRRQRERGVEIRTLYSQQTLRDASLRDYMRRKAALGMRIRAAPITPIRMLVYDRELAIVDAPRDADIGAIVIRDRLLAEPLVDFFEYCWITASDLDDVVGSTDESGLTDQQRAVLRLLASGAKDEAIARGLGISVRTVTRIVAELSAQLGATSRFQAGVKAARLGWLD